MSAETKANDHAAKHVFLLADHLDAVLAGGEDMIAIPPVEAAGPKGRKAMHAGLDDRRRFVESVRTLEIAIVARVLKAREHAQSLKGDDARCKLVGELFVASTHALVDAAASLGDLTGHAFDTGFDAIAYLRSRGLVASDAAGIGGAEALAMTEDFRIAGVVPLGVLLDLVATFLDTLDLVFELYGDGDADASGETVGLQDAAPAAA